jgi:hypothetical protein
VQSNYVPPGSEGGLVTAEEGSSAAIERVWKRVLEDPRGALEHGLTPTERRAGDAAGRPPR